MSAKPIDVTLLGVTGYTGRLALRYLASLPAEERGVVALAGRDPEKLSRVAAELAPDLSATLLEVDVTRPETLAEMATQSRVLINLAGPYGEHGPEVVAACVEHGTDYVDLTGEPLFVREMIDSHHRAAADEGLRIVHSCGFESLPFDMTTLFAVTTLHNATGEDCAEVNLSLEMKFKDPAVMRDRMLSGGTAATIVALLSSEHGPELVDPALLVPGSYPQVPARSRHPLPSKAIKDPATDAWATPVYPAPTLNPQVILRSAGLYGEGGMPYGSEFRYRECASLRGLVPRPLQRAAAVAVSAGIAHAMRVVEKGPSWEKAALVQAVKKVSAERGAGPREDLLSAFDYTIHGVARSPSGNSVSVRYDGAGNPGYLSTAKLVVQAGLALAFDRLRQPEIFGVVTPAAALGMAFVDRLPRADVSLSQLR